MAVDLIYNVQLTRQFELSDSTFFFADSFGSAVRALPIMCHDRGATGAAKLFCKVSVHRCVYFGLARGCTPISTGVIALGYCKFYPVPPNSAVIGEIVTAAANRGMGHATRAIKLAINAMIRKGLTNFFIDTQRQNIPMIKSIANLGFGRPIGGDAAAECPWP